MLKIIIVYILSLFILTCKEDLNPLGLQCDEGLIEENGECVDECGIVNGPGIPDTECDCEGSVQDCNGVCAGESIADECGTCDDDPDNDCVQDCNGDWGGEAVDDECGICGGDNTTCDEGCGPNEPAPSGCDNTCGSTLENDECGVCGGDNLSLIHI